MFISATRHTILHAYTTVPVHIDSQHHLNIQKRAEIIAAHLYNSTVYVSRLCFFIIIFTVHFVKQCVLYLKQASSGKSKFLHISWYTCTAFPVVCGCCVMAFDFQDSFQCEKNDYKYVLRGLYPPVAPECDTSSSRWRIRSKQVRHNVATSASPGRPRRQT